MLGQHIECWTLCFIRRNKCVNIQEHKENHMVHRSKSTALPYERIVGQLKRDNAHEH